MVFFNIYLKMGGKTEGFMGSVQSAKTLAVVLVSIPMGFLACRLGPKRSLIVAIPLIALGFSFTSLTLEPLFLILFPFIAGGAQMLINAVSTPFLYA
jgi:fucose permease